MLSTAPKSSIPSPEKNLESPPVARLQAALSFLKTQFAGKDDIIDLLGICLVARENIFLYGPPGTAKSALIRGLAQAVPDGKNFEYLLTRFTEPSEIFGPFDIRLLKEGELKTNTEGMMPEASLVFLDELFNANSAILNSLLTALNEKIFRRGKDVQRLPVLMFAGASNALPEDEALTALFDRFLVRVNCRNVAPDLLSQVLVAGRKLEQQKATESPLITTAELEALQAACQTVNLAPVADTYVQAIFALRSAGISVSDRRAVKMQSLVAASALLCGRTIATLSDLWVLKHVWDTEEQVEILEGIVNHLIEKDAPETAHPQAYANHAPDAETLMQDVKKLAEAWKNPDLKPSEQNVVKDQLRYLQTRCDWIKKPEQKQFVQAEIDALWKTILHTL